MSWKSFFEARHSIPDNALTKTRELGGISIITDTIVPIENFKGYLDKIHTKIREYDLEYLLFGIDISGWPTIMVTLLFLGGTILFAIGILGIYIGKVHNALKNRPQYIIESKKGFDKTNN